MKRIALLVLIVALLAACTADQIGSGAKSWCRNTPDRCTVNE